MKEIDIILRSNKRSEEYPLRFECENIQDFKELFLRRWDDLFNPWEIESWNNIINEYSIVKKIISEEDTLYHIARRIDLETKVWEMEYEEREI